MGFVFCNDLHKPQHPDALAEYNLWEKKIYTILKQYNVILSKRIEFGRFLTSVHWGKTLKKMSTKFKMLEFF